jgi:hypothetical protein
MPPHFICWFALSSLCRLSDLHFSPCSQQPRWSLFCHLLVYGMWNSLPLQLQQLTGCFFWTV